MYVKTQRLELDLIRPESLDSLVELLADDAVKRTYMVPDFTDREETVKLARRMLELSRKKDRIVMGIYLDGELVGILNETEVLGDSVELGYAILPRFQNRGIGTEALKGAIDYCFDRGFREVTAGAFAQNRPSFRVMEKNGMTRLEKTDEIVYRGKVYRCLYYGIQKPAQRESILPEVL